MELAEARALVKHKTDKEITVRHLISVEGVMRALARCFGEDQDRWALAGLFHDLDQDRTGGRLLAARLPGRRMAARGRRGGTSGQRRPGPRARAVPHRPHVQGRGPCRRYRRAAGAAALVRSERSAGMKVSSVKKKLKERSFAPGVNREEIYGVEPTLGLPWRSSSPPPSPASSRSRRRSACRWRRSPAASELRLSGRFVVWRRAARQACMGMVLGQPC